MRYLGLFVVGLLGCTEPAPDRDPEDCDVGEYLTSGECTALTECGESEYEAAAPTATADRECAAVTVCEADEYQSQAATGTSDAVCTALTTCDSDAYESTAPTSTSDRVCTQTTVCTGEQYEEIAPTTTSDRVCTALTPCTGAKYESVAPTATSDRVCEDLTVCQAGEYQSAPPTPTSDRGCTALTQCTASQYISVPATATSDRTCTDVSLCVRGESVQVEPSTYADRECAACPSGTWCPGGIAARQDCLGLDHDGDPATPCAKGVAVDLSAGAHHACAVEQGGGVVCWGIQEYGEANVPAWVEDAVAVAAGADHTCVVDDAGAVGCWGRSDDARTTPPNDLGFVEALVAGDEHTCALDDQGAVSCWGGNDDLQLDVPDLGSVVQIAAGARHTCALDEQGVVVCWGSNAEGQLARPAAEPDAVHISAGGTWSCEETEAGHVLCWGIDDLDEGDPGFFVAYVGSAGGQLSASGHGWICSVQAGALSCTTPRGGHVDVPTFEESGAVSQISLGDAYGCAINESGRVTCFGALDALDVPRVLALDRRRVEGVARYSVDVDGVSRCRSTHMLDGMEYLRAECPGCTFLFEVEATVLEDHNAPACDRPMDWRYTWQQTELDNGGYSYLYPQYPLMVLTPQFYGYDYDAGGYGYHAYYNAFFAADWLRAPDYLELLHWEDSDGVPQTDSTLEITGDCSAGNGGCEVSWEHEEVSEGGPLGLRLQDCEAYADEVYSCVTPEGDCPTDDATAASSPDEYPGTFLDCPTPRGDRWEAAVPAGGTLAVAVDIVDATHLFDPILWVNDSTGCTTRLVDNRQACSAGQCSHPSVGGYDCCASMEYLNEGTEEEVVSIFVGQYGAGCVDTAEQRGEYVLKVAGATGVVLVEDDYTDRQVLRASGTVTVSEP